MVVAFLAINLNERINIDKTTYIHRLLGAFPMKLKGLSRYRLTMGYVQHALESQADRRKAKLIQRQLVESQKLACLGLVVSGMVHEVKNFNNCITFNIPILREYLRELIPIVDDYVRRHRGFEVFGMSYSQFREDIFKPLDNLEYACGQISATVSGLGEFVRGGDDGKRRPVELRRVVERGVALCGYQIKKMVRSFELDIAGDLARVFTHPEALEQVVVNLLMNAAQAADKGDSWVGLRAWRGGPCGGHVVIEMSDNGCGMDEQTRLRIFEPFFTTRAAGGGTGLGLFVSRNLVEGLGGRIEVESEPGKGSTFRVILKGANPGRRKALRNGT